MRLEIRRFDLRRSLCCAALTTMLATGAMAQQPPVGDDPRPHEPPVAVATEQPPAPVDGRSVTRLVSWQRDYADGVLAGVDYMAKHAVSDAEQRGTVSPAALEYLRYRGMVTERVTTALQDGLRPLERQEVTVGSTNGQSYTGTLFYIGSNKIGLSVDNLRRYDGSEGKGAVYFYWGAISEDSQNHLITSRGLTVDPFVRVAQHVRRNRLAEALAIVENESDIASRIVALRLRELIEDKVKVRIPAMFYSRAPKYRPAALRAVRADTDIDARIDSFLTSMAAAHPASGSWSRDQNESGLMTYAFLLNAHHPNSKALGHIVADELDLAGRMPIGPHLLAVGEAWAFTGQANYRLAFERSIDEVLQFWSRSWPAQTYRSRSWMLNAVRATEALQLSFALGYRQEDCARDLAKIRNTLRNSYNEGTKTFDFVRSGSSWLSGYDDACFLYVTRVCGDVTHPYIPIAKKNYTDFLRDVKLDARSPMLQDQFVLGEVASLLGGEAGQLYVKNVVNPILATKDFGVGPTTELPAGTALMVVAIQGIWRYDWREVDRLAKQIKDAAR